jgi:hypothetical protein
MLATSNPSNKSSSVHKFEKNVTCDVIICVINPENKQRIRMVKAFPMMEIYSFSVGLRKKSGKTNRMMKAYQFNWY